LNDTHDRGEKTSVSFLTRGVRAATIHASRRPVAPEAAELNGRAHRAHLPPLSRFRRVEMSTPLVGVIMGSRSDWETMKESVEVLAALGIAHEVRVVSAHRTPDLLFEYASSAEERGIRVIIAGAGGAAHLPGMTASKTLLPVLGVPVQSRTLQGVDSLLSIVQMPAGVPVGTLAIGAAGAVTAALLAAQILGGSDLRIKKAVRAWRAVRTDAVLSDPDPRAARG
jgi:5-(carboxyamino)imidazole ribonucleotide mutase